MIKARSGAVIVLGLQSENFRRLEQDKPMVINGEDLGIQGGLKIVIIHYTDVKDAEAKMKKMGFDIPETKTDPSGN